MACAARGCSLGPDVVVSPCCVCEHLVHHLCSNELCTEDDLSVRFCSEACVRSFRANRDEDKSRDAQTRRPASEDELVVDVMPSRFRHNVMTEIQRETLLASYLPVFRRMALDQLRAAEFLCYDLEVHLTAATTEVNLPRRLRLVASFSDPGKVCLQRTLCQIRRRLRLPEPEAVIALLLDPRTKESVLPLVEDENCSSVHAASILSSGLHFLREEHYKLYRARYYQPTNNDASGYQANDQGRQGPPPPTSNPAIYGARIRGASNKGTQDEQLREASDKIVRDWLDHCVDWGEVAADQHTDSVQEWHPPSLQVVDENGNAYWDLLALYREIDIHVWFHGSGQGQFPTIASLARIWLGKISSTAFQERVFSTGSIVMSPKRTQTDNKRAEKQMILSHNRSVAAELGE